MQIEYRLSLRNYQEANQTHLKLLRWNYFLFWFSTLFGLFFLLLFLLSLLDDKPIVFTVLFLLFPTVWFLFFPIILFNPYFSNPIKSYFRERDWKNLVYLHQPMSVEVTEEMLKFKSSNFERSVEWQFYIQAVETNQLFIFYEANPSFYMIPKRAFSSDQQVEEFRELVLTKIEKFKKV